MKLGMNHPMGPLELADFIGLDVCVNILEVLYAGFGDSKYRACALLRKMVAAGWLGRFGDTDNGGGETRPPRKLVATRCASHSQRRPDRDRSASSDD